MTDADRPQLPVRRRGTGNPITELAEMERSPFDAFARPGRKPTDPAALLRPDFTGDPLWSPVVSGDEEVE